MKIKLFLRIRQDRKEPTITLSRPAAQLGVVVIPLNMEIPDSLFLPPEIPTVEVVLDESVLPHVAALNEHMEALQDAGVKVRLVQK